MYWPWEEMPKFYPLTFLRFGLWQSQLHIKDQLFVMFYEEKFVFVVVHPPKDGTSSQSTRKSNSEDQIAFLFNKKKILKYFGNKNPFTTVTDLGDGR